jgi:predicted  nucleic acid-binding Zn-ribbon protein
MTAAEELIEQLQRDLRGLRDQGLVDAREITRLTQANEGLNAQLREANDRIADASRDIEHLYLGATMDLQRHTDRFNTVRRIREQLDPTLAQSPPFTIHPPRAAAGAH